MNAFAHLAEARRHDARSCECEARHYEAVGNAEQAKFYRDLAANYWKQAEEMQAFAESEAA
jgi:hypothetical protein